MQFANEKKKKEEDDEKNMLRIKIHEKDCKHCK